MYLRNTFPCEAAVSGGLISLSFLKTKSISSPNRSHTLSAVTQKYIIHLLRKSRPPKLKLSFHNQDALENRNSLASRGLPRLPILSLSQIRAFAGQHHNIRLPVSTGNKKPPLHSPSLTILSFLWQPDVLPCPPPPSPTCKHTRYEECRHLTNTY